jgi:glycosyltransferase involved in cell wall biosynthesis
MVVAMSRNPGESCLVFMVDDIFPTPKAGYGSPRSWAIIEMLSKRRSVVLCETAGCERATRTHSELDGRVRIFSPLGDQVVEVLRGLFATMPVAEAFIWVSGPGNLRKALEALEGVQPRPVILYDVESLSYRRRRRQQAIYPGVDFGIDAEQAELDEIVDIAQTDVVAVASHDEAAILGETLELPIFRLGHRHELNPTTSTWPQRRKILLLGGFTGFANGAWSAPIGRRSGNHDAAMYFLSDVFPIIRAQSELRVEIVGFRSELLNDWPVVEGDERIAVLGSLDDLGPAYETALCAAAPTRIAAGLAWKATEALSFGVPLVATTLIADQLGPEGRDLALAADDPAGLAGRILDLARDENLWTSKRAAGLRHVERRESPAVFEAALMDAVTAAEAMTGSRQRAH